MYIHNVIITTMCPPGYLHNGFLATYALAHLMYGLFLMYCFGYIMCPSA